MLTSDNDNNAENRQKTPDLFATSQSFSADPANTAGSPGELQLHALCKELLRGQRLLIASNRGPVTYEASPAGGPPLAKRGSGGVVTALSSLARFTPVTWVAAALSETDREIARRGQAVTTGSNLEVRLVDIEPEAFEQYLNFISNPLLWFVQHEMDGSLAERYAYPHVRQAWQTGYVEANRSFARAVLQEARRPGVAPYVVFHDYQLYLAPALVRQTRPDLTLLHFTHIPWPAPARWEHLPVEIVCQICAALLSCQLLGFQTRQDVENFVQTCQEFLPRAQVYCEGPGSYRVNYGPYQTQVRDYPISIDPAQVRQTYESPQAQQWRWRLAAQLDLQESDRLIVRVDRLDPSKNVVAGFEAYARLLQTHPEWQGRVKFLALLVPTRETVSEYWNYRNQTFALIKQINEQFGRDDWQPIHYIYGNDYSRALAGLSLADVVLVNSLADGMNLVAKETCLVNENDGVLVLSQKIGSWQELGGWALGVNPTNVGMTAEQLQRGLTMSAVERHQRSQQLASLVYDHDLSNWLSSQLRDLAAANRPTNRLAAFS